MKIAQATFSIALSALLATLTACSNSDGGSASAQREGVFLDSAVTGLSYQTATGSGVTNEAGQYSYQSGESISFSIGNWVLPSVKAAPVITPLSVFGAESASNLSVSNLARLLQSLDGDSNPENGIDLTGLENAQNMPLASELSMEDFSSAQFDVIAANFLARSGIGNDELIDASVAQTHLNSTLESNGLLAGACTAAHAHVGAEAEFDTYHHGVTGKVKVIDDCTLEISEFNYDGLGPQVFFYLAKQRDYSGPEAVKIGAQLNGTVFVDDVIRLTLPEGTTLDNVDSISVWCADVDVNFGDAFFGG